MTKAQLKAVLELIGAKLKGARDARSWNQRGVAKAAGIELSAYGPMERGTGRRYRIDQFILVLDALDFNVLDIFQDENWKRREARTKEDPIVARTLEQAREVLEYNDEERDNAVNNIRRWHKALPKKKPSS